MFEANMESTARLFKTQESREWFEKAFAEHLATYGVLEEQHRLAEEQARLAAEQERMQAELDKHAAKIADLEFKMNRAEADIDNLTFRIDELKKYGEYLELERDACVYGSSNYYKWHKKVMTNDNQVYTLTSRLDKAIYAKEKAAREIATV